MPSPAPLPPEALRRTAAFRDSDRPLASLTDAMTVYGGLTTALGRALLRRGLPARGAALLGDLLVRPHEAQVMGRMVAAVDAAAVPALVAPRLAAHR